MKKKFFHYSVFCLLSISGCSSSSDFNPSLDYNPGWSNESNTTSFDQIPRNKNHLEYGVE